MCYIYSLINLFYQQTPRMKQDLSQRLIKDLENFDTISGIELQKSLVQWLDKEVPYYNWTGFFIS